MTKKPHTYDLGWYTLPSGARAHCLAKVAVEITFEGVPDGEPHASFDARLPQALASLRAHLSRVEYTPDGWRDLSDGALTGGRLAR